MGAIGTTKTLDRGARAKRGTTRSHKGARMLVDVVLAILMTASALSGFGDAPGHAMMGMLLAILAAVHCVLNRTWFAHLPAIVTRCRGNARLTARTIADIVLVVSMLVCAVSAPLATVRFASSLGLAEPLAATVLLHDVSAIVCLAASAVHVGLHVKKRRRA